MVVSKMNRMVVLACIENEIAIQERHGGVNQKWSQDNKTIVSSKYQTAICVKDSGNVPICVKKEKAFGHLCYLQSSVSVFTPQLSGNKKENEPHIFNYR